MAVTQFKPPFWAKNRHVQTIWPRFIQKRKPIQLSWSEFELPDGDFVDLAWCQAKGAAKGVAVLFHGLEGSARSHYANDMLATLTANGWQSVVMHFRGCGQGINRLARSYHSGDTEDAKLFLQYLAEHMPNLPKVAIGFSLGANMLLKLLGENPNQSWVKGAVAIAPPFRLADCAQSVNRGFSKVYQYYLLNSMRKKTLAKLDRGDFNNFPFLTRKVIDNIKSFKEFDELVTAPLHGFDNAHDYYVKAGAEHHCQTIKTPTLMLHSKDDPFMSPAVIPQDNELSPAVQLELSEFGGHVGFMQGSPWDTRVWLHQRVPDYLNKFKL